MSDYRLEIPGMVPPSFNRTSHAHWRYVQRVKTEWEHQLGNALLAASVPRRLDRVQADAELRFGVRRRRDEGNFRVVLEKSLGDVLTKGGWLEDDTPDHYSFGAVVIGQHPGTRLTVVHLTTVP